MRNWSDRLAGRLGQRRKVRTACAGAAVLSSALVYAMPGSAATLLVQDWEGLPLEPFVELQGGDGTDFTTVLPAGWTRDTTTTPAPAPNAPEYFGPQAMDVDSWVAQAGQDRNLFTKGGVGAGGTVVVFDADQFDDETPIEPNLFNAFLISPSISLAGLPANNITLRFDSSFRPYDTMTGLVDVSFNNGATWTNVLTLDTAGTPGGNSSLARVNENVELPINNPAGGAMRVRFGLTQAGNDWWWAIDNVRVFSQAAVLGDVNGDNLVNLFDFDIIRANFYEGDELEEGDVNQDGIVDEVDFRIWKNNYEGPGAPNSVPEPSSAMLLAGGASLAAWALRRRRERK